MPVKQLDPAQLGHDEDWYGNNAAFTCPCCGKVFIVSKFPVKKGEGGKRMCSCGKATGYCSGSSKENGKAWIQWDTEQQNREHNA